MKDQICLSIERHSHVVLDETKSGIVSKMLHIGQHAGNQIVDANDLEPFLKKAVTEVGTDEPGPAGYQRFQLKLSLGQPVPNHSGGRIARGHSANQPRPITPAFTHGSAPE